MILIPLITQRSPIEKYFVSARAYIGIGKWAAIGEKAVVSIPRNIIQADFYTIRWVERLTTVFGDGPGVTETSVAPASVD